jgi:uncharacterized membrane protein (UPF0127 family)
MIVVVTLVFKPLRIAVLIGAILIFPAILALACHFELPTTAAAVKGRELTVELAVTPYTRSCGLSRRSSLSEDRGMLFVYPKPQKLSFWMKDTLIPLSIAFIDDAGRITGIQKMDPTPPRRFYTSPGWARFALEVNQGWFEKNGIGVGDVVGFNLPITLDIR